MIEVKETLLEKLHRYKWMLIAVTAFALVRALGYACDLIFFFRREDDQDRFR